MVIYTLILIFYITTNTEVFVMNVAICDDNILIVNQVTSFLKDYSQTNKYQFDIFCFTGSSEMLKSSRIFDMAYIDVEMPEVNGLELTKKLKAINPNIIIFIITSHQGYLDDAMGLNVFRFLSKPIDKERFLKNTSAAVNLYKNNTQNIIIDSPDNIVNVFTNDIIYITIDDKKVRIITKNTEYLSGKSFNKWRENLTCFPCFAQPHYSYIVNMNYIKSIRKTNVTLSSGGNTIDIPISRRYYNEFKTEFFKYVGTVI